ncbi:hypothetical protein ACKKBF_B37935 [Auxenochlorella protothecoides x Auxenochlorella symbiontica]
MGEDLRRLEEAEQRIINALDGAAAVMLELERGGVEVGTRTLEVLQNLEEAEITLLELCDRHAEPLPLKYAQWPTTLRRLTTSAQPGTPGHHTLGSGGPNVQETDDGMDLDHD